MADLPDATHCRVRHMGGRLAPGATNTGASHRPRYSRQALHQRSAGMPLQGRGPASATAISGRPALVPAGRVPTAPRQRPGCRRLLHRPQITGRFCPPVFSAPWRPRAALHSQPRWPAETGGPVPAGSQSTSPRRLHQPAGGPCGRRLPASRPQRRPRENATPAVQHPYGQRHAAHKNAHPAALPARGPVAD